MLLKLQGKKSWLGVSELWIFMSSLKMLKPSAVPSFAQVSISTPHTSMTPQKWRSSPRPLPVAAWTLSEWVCRQAWSLHSSLSSPCLWRLVARQVLPTSSSQWTLMILSSLCTHIKQLRRLQLCRSCCNGAKEAAFSFVFVGQCSTIPLSFVSLSHASIVGHVPGGTARWLF